MSALPYIAIFGCGAFVGFIVASIVFFGRDYEDGAP